MRLGMEDGERTPVEGTHGLLEDDALVVALALPLRLDAVAACRLALVALDPSLATGLKQAVLGMGTRAIKGGYVLRHPVLVLFRMFNFFEGTLSFGSSPSGGGGA